MLAVEVDVPLMASAVLPITPRNMVLMLALNVTVEVTVEPLLTTVGVTLPSV